MTPAEVTAIYEWAAAILPGEGKWKKPRDAAGLLAHQKALRNVSFELGCVAAMHVVEVWDKWPTAPLMIKAARDFGGDHFDPERAKMLVGDLRFKESSEIVKEVAALAMKQGGHMQPVVPRVAPKSIEI